MCEEHLSDSVYGSGVLIILILQPLSMISIFAIKPHFGKAGLGSESTTEE